MLTDTPKPVRNIGDYLTLPLKLPSLPAFPCPATHYLYVRKHTSKKPTPADSRTLFLVNIPIDATEAHFRAVFASLIGVGKVESVNFEGTRSASKPAVAPVVPEKSKKRKRAGGISTSLEAASELPAVWDRDVRKSGSTATLVFVDEPSAVAALKAVRRLKGRPVEEFVWGEGVDQPPLGSKSIGPCHLW
jgi:ribosomal RNA-processing protein 7